jgi:hypothetical protein
MNIGSTSHPSQASLVLYYRSILRRFVPHSVNISLGSFSVFPDLLRRSVSIAFELLRRSVSIAFELLRRSVSIAFQLLLGLTWRSHVDHVDVVLDLVRSFVSFFFFRFGAALLGSNSTGGNVVFESMLRFGEGCVLMRLVVRKSGGKFVVGMPDATDGENCTLICTAVVHYAEFQFVEMGNLLKLWYQMSLQISSITCPQLISRLSFASVSLSCRRLSSSE